jgi:hypothetical protein
MNRRVVQWIFLFALAGILAFAGGCASDEPQNASVRPWNSPQGWEGGLPMDMNQQHE